MRIVAALTASFALACGAAAPSPQARAPPTATVIPQVMGSGVGAYVSSPWGFETNSFWIEGPTGLVLIDTQFMPSATVEAIEAAEAATGKPIVLAVVLHANPDKFNGTATLQARGVRVVTSAQVLAAIPAVHRKRVGWFYERYKPDYPKDAAAPAAFGAVTTELRAGGLTLRAHVLGAGCSPAHVVIEHDGHVFVGDLVANGHHSWLELGLLDAWRARLDEIGALSPKFVHPGRGASGGPELLGRQREYLDRVEGIIASFEPTGRATGEQLEAVRRQIVEAYPTYDYKVFLRTGAPAAWKTVVQKRRAR